MSEKQINKKVQFSHMKGKSKDALQANIQQIASLKQHNQTLQEDLAQDYKSHDFEKLESLQDDCSNYAKKIEVESKRQKDLEQLINIAEQQLQDHRKKMSTSDGVQLPSLIKKQKTLESQLEQIKLKHNESLAEINQLMEQINTARRERVIYSNVFKKLECDIRSKEEEFKKQLFIRKQIEYELEQTQQQFDKMKETANIVLESNHQEYNSILKSNRLDESDDILMESQNKSEVKTIHHKETLQQPKQQMQQIQMQKDVDDVNNYEFMFEKLKKETGLKSIEEIIHVYRTIEETNEELFKQANQLSDQIDQEEKAIQQIQGQIKSYTKVPQKEDIETEEEKFKYGQQLERQEKIDKELNEAEQEVKEIENELMELAQKLNIQINPTSEATIMQLVEQRAYELIDLCKYYDSQPLNIDTSKKTEYESMVSQRDDQVMKDLLDGVENEKEAEKIMSRNDFKEIGAKELVQFQKKQVYKKKKD